ncbi:PRC-barrel domain-containing protein [Thioclava sp. FTW29]|uniref:PRC-barrel domain-containing protein n=1 Tax=Thioclava litoralis TaxID=3076557 RepID=A0ABZ1E4G5_9RHOB|nr:PRC-barrel domain-containing protein [Thioclava sp. FTW29]
MKFLTTTAVALALATGAAYAEDTNANATADTAAPAKMATQATANGLDMSDSTNLIRARDITGGDIYTIAKDSGKTWDTMDWNAVSSDWNGDGFDDIGEIEDIVLSPEGKMVGVVAEVGGFLDIGDKHVVIPVDATHLVPIDDGKYVVVTSQTEDQLKDAKDVDEGFWN